MSVPRHSSHLSLLADLSTVCLTLADIRDVPLSHDICLIHRKTHSFFFLYVLSSMICCLNFFSVLQFLLLSKPFVSISLYLVVCLLPPAFEAMCMSIGS